VGSAIHFSPFSLSGIETKETGNGTMLTVMNGSEVTATVLSIWYYVKLCLSVWLFEIRPQVHSPQPKVDNYKIKCPFPIHPQAQRPTLLCNSTTYYVKLCLSVWLFEIRPQVHSPQPKRDNCKIKCPFPIRPQAQKPTLLSNEKLCLSVWLFEIRPQFHSPQNKVR
jgi:hypothetical protein